MTRHMWTDEEKETLRQIIPGRQMNEIIDEAEKAFGWRPTKSQIKNMQTHLNIHSGFRYRWKKGHVPHNKGKHFQSGGRSAETRFKKGNIPPQHRPVGSTRINSDGYHMVKVADPNVWMMTHQMIYESHHGKVPKGRFVIFLDKNKDNLDIDNLIDVSRSELVRINQNGILEYPKELKRSAILAIKLEVAIRERRRNK